jgi:hypothetical protein
VLEPFETLGNLDTIEVRHLDQLLQPQALGCFEWLQVEDDHLAERGHLGHHERRGLELAFVWLIEHYSSFHDTEGAEGTEMDEDEGMGHVQVAAIDQ